MRMEKIQPPGAPLAPRRSRRLSCLVWLSCLFIGLAQLMAQQPPMAPKLTPLPHPEIPAPEPPPPPLDWMTLSLGALILGIFMGLLIWLLFKTPAKRPTPAPAALDVALQALKELAARAPQTEPSEISHQVSVILRDYQYATYGMPAPWSTSEELYEGHVNPYSSRAVERFGPLATLYDRLSFGSQPATLAEATSLIDEAVHALGKERGVMSLPFHPHRSVPPPLPLSRPSA